MGIILVTTEASTTCMYVRMYVGRRKKNYSTPRREGKGGEGKGTHGKGVTLKGKEETKREIKTHLNELTHNSSLHYNRVLSNDYDSSLQCPFTVAGQGACNENRASAACTPN